MSTDLAPFLRGQTTLCPVCLSPRESCPPGRPCCAHCPGWHLHAHKPRTRQISKEE